MHKLAKSYQRRDLMPLYEEHSIYILRTLKTCIDEGIIDIDKFIAKLPRFIEIAKCHEVAINDFTNLDIETHQNGRGKEKDYTNHPSAKKVGRDLRVKIIWELVEKELLLDKNLSSFEAYDDFNKVHDKIYYCPYCNEEIGREIAERVIDGYHEDGTENFHYQFIQFEWNDDSECPHFAFDDNDVNYYFIGQYQDKLDELWLKYKKKYPLEYRHFSEIKEILEANNIEYDDIVFRNNYGNVSGWWIFIKEPKEFLEKFEEIFIKISEEEYGDD